MSDAGAEGTITAKTDIDIVNTALIRMGQSPISAFGVQSGSGLILQSSYNMSRDDLLRKQPWSFAKRWISLNSLSVAPINLDIIPEASGPGVIQFTNAYQLPNDCLRVFRFSPKDAHWRIVGRTILSDAVPATTVGTLLGLQPLGSNGSQNQPTSASVGNSPTIGIEYIAQTVDPGLWDATFMNCFVWKLCKELAMGITGIVQWYKVAKEEYDDAMISAAVMNGLEAWPDPYWNTDLNDVRYGYVGVTIEGY